MSDWSLFFNTALISGLALSIVLTTIMVISAAIAPDMWISKYPPDIQEKYGPISSRAARFRPYVAVVFFAIFLVTPLLGLFVLRSRAGELHPKKWTGS